MHTAYLYLSSKMHAADRIINYYTHLQIYENMHKYIINVLIMPITCMLKNVFM